MKRKASVNINESAGAAEHTLFLSHSHKDKSIVEGLIIFLGTLGINIYVDWNDSGMPRITDRQTADRIKQKISQCKNFAVLATSNALASRWVPWEVGVADQIKSARGVFIIPVVDSTGVYKGSEYLQLYPTVESTSKGGWGVFQPNQSTGGILLEDFIQR